MNSFILFYATLGVSPENAFCTTCFKENHDKLCIIVNKARTLYFAIFFLLGTRKPLNTKMTVLAKLNYQRLRYRSMQNRCNFCVS